MSDLDRHRINGLYEAELERFVGGRPRSAEKLARARRSMPGGVPMPWMSALYAHPTLFVAEGQGTYFTDIDGHRYLDMNHADMSMSCGFAPRPIVAAVAEQVARGSQFLLPTEASIEVSELLADRFMLPFWQYTLSATSANTEAIRIARAATGRRRVLTFDGGYHGLLDDTMEAVRESELPAGRWPDSVMVHYNDLDAVERVLRERFTACVVVEPAITNINLVKPDSGFHKSLRDLARRFGSLLVIDETHTHVCAWGGLTRAWELEPDLLVLGKSIGGGIPLGAYGMTESLARVCEANNPRDEWPGGDSSSLWLGGTLHGNPVGLVAARAALREILTPEAHARTAALGGYLADGIERTVKQAGLPWSAHRLYSRTGVCYADRAPRNAIEASRAADFELNRLHRVFLANRGIWEAVVTAGPAVSFAAERGDMDRYLEVFEELIGAITD
jgi:glutamate-1-semialdehyde 2,1-aminomutase